MGQSAEIEQTFFGGAVPGMQINACQGASVKVVFNVVVHREEDTLRRLAKWIETTQLCKAANE